MDNEKDLQKKVQVEAWQHAHPAGLLTHCMRDTGLLYKDVKKWWNRALPDRYSTQHRVREWFSLNPKGTLRDCAAELGVSPATVKVWRPTDSEASDILSTVVRTWQKLHPGGSRTACMRDTGLSRYRIAPYFVPPEHTQRDDSGRFARVCRWLLDHPDGTFCDCAQALQMSVGTLSEIWNLCLTRPVSCPRCGGLLIRCARGREAGFHHLRREEACTDDFMTMEEYRRLRDLTNAPTP